MEKTKLTKWLCGSVSFLLIFSMLCGMAAVPANAAAGNFKASYIEKLDGIKADYESYLDSSVMYRLPEGIRDDEEISVIITVDGVHI